MKPRGIGQDGTILRQQGASGSCDDVQPVTLKFVQAECHFPDIIISWATESEINNDYFTLEKSYDLMYWFEVTKIKGAGNSNSIKKYNSIDPITKEEKIYYRLKQTDFDGSYQYSNIIVVQCESIKSFETSVHPNPFKDLVHLSLISDDSAVISIEIKSISGQNVLSSQYIVEKGVTDIEMDLSFLTESIYFLYIRGDNYLETHKLIKL